MALAVIIHHELVERHPSGIDQDGPHPGILDQLNRGNLRRILRRHGERGWRPRHRHNEEVVVTRLADGVAGPEVIYVQVQRLVVVGDL